MWFLRKPNPGNPLNQKIVFNKKTRPGKPGTGYSISKAIFMACNSFELLMWLNLACRHHNTQNIFGKYGRQ